MATILKTEEEKDILREGGRRLSAIFDKLASATHAGITTLELDQLAEKMVREGGDTPSLLGYQPYGADRPFPATVCICVNDEVVHGIPSKDRVIQDGDLVTFDLVITHKGLMTDSARTIAVGKISKEEKKLMQINQEALEAGINAVRAGVHVGDIGKAIEKVVKAHGYGIPRELGGHGVGKHVHEEPYIPHYDMGSKGEKLVDGQVIAIEPMLLLGSRAVVFENDGYTVRSKDGARSTHFEHTMIVTKNGAEVVTRSQRSESSV